MEAILSRPSSATTLIFSIDAEGRCISFNQAYSDKLHDRYQQRPKLGEAWPGIQGSEELDSLRANLLSAVLAPDTTSIPMDDWRALGCRELAGVECTPLLLQDGNHGLTVALSEKKVEFGEEELFHIANDLLAISNFDNYFLELNEQWAKVLGYSLEELKAVPFLNFLHPDDLQATKAEANELYEGKPQAIRFKNRYRTKSGDYVWLEWNAVIDYEKQLSYSVARDVTPREELNQRLTQSEERYRSVVASLHEGIVVQDMQDRILMCNQSAANILGLTVDQLMGKDSFDPRWKALNEEGQPLDPNEHPSVVTLRTGEAVKDFLMNVQSGDDQRRIITINSNPILNDQGEMYGAVASFLDVTTEKTALINLEKALEVKTLLFRELHHRIKNNLNLISNVMYLKSEAADDPGLRHFVSETNSRILSIAKIHEQLLEMEEANQLYTRDYLNDLVSTLVLTYASNKELYKIEFEVENHKLDVDRILMVGLITNEVLSNILKYAYDPAVGGVILVRLWKEGDDIHLLLGDEGHGMTEQKSPSASIGMDLITMFSKQLNGTMKKDVSAGVKYTFQFPQGTEKADS